MPQGRLRTYVGVFITLCWAGKPPTSKARQILALQGPGYCPWVSSPMKCLDTQR